jgi:hypothetical protein
MTNHKSAVSLLAALAVGLLLSVPTLGSEASLHTNYFHFDRAVGLPGVELAPGTYIFERAEATNQDVVVVRDRARTRVYFLGATNRVDRPRHLARGSAITLGEARPGVAPPIAVWYPLDSSRGHGFIYR